MDRTTPSPGNEEIELYIKTYFSLLRSSGSVRVKALEETHGAMRSSLHAKAESHEPDTGAFTYAGLRLPSVIDETDLVILGQSEEVFERRGYYSVNEWESVESPARRRKMFYDGNGTLAAFIASVSDIDDMIPMLTAYQVEWNKMHTLLNVQRNVVERLETLAGDAVAELPSEPPAFDPEELPRWSFFRIPEEEDGGEVLPAALLLPPGVERGEEAGLPVLMYHYGCPASQVVRDRWSSGRRLWHKLMAERGYAVLMVDNRGSSFFGKEGEDRAYRRFGKGNLEAQLAAVEWLRGQPFAEAERIGLWGWSGGGSNTLYALLNAPGTWRAGVAGAPVTDWRYYDTIWTERYLDRPQDNPEGYEASSPVTYAADLENDLLIVHGTADDNVHPHNTLAMTEALAAAGKPYEMAIYPGQKHGFRGAAERHFFERMTAFFERTLRGD